MTTKIETQPPAAVNTTIAIDPTVTAEQQQEVAEVTVDQPQRNTEEVEQQIAEAPYTTEPLISPYDRAEKFDFDKVDFNDCFAYRRDVQGSGIVTTTMTGKVADYGDALSMLVIVEEWDDPTKENSQVRISVQIDDLFADPTEILPFVAANCSLAFWDSYNKFKLRVLDALRKQRNNEGVYDGCEEQACRDRQLRTLADILLFTK